MYNIRGLALSRGLRLNGGSVVSLRPGFGRKRVAHWGRYYRTILAPLAATTITATVIPGICSTLVVPWGLTLVLVLASRFSGFGGVRYRSGWGGLGWR